MGVPSTLGGEAPRVRGASRHPPVLALANVDSACQRNSPDRGLLSRPRRWEDFLYDSGPNLLLDTPWAASLSINWVLGDGLPHWMARYLAALGVPASPPEGWPGWAGFVVVVGAVLASMALTLIGVIAGALVIFWVRKTFLGYVPPSLTDDP